MTSPWRAGSRLSGLVAAAASVAGQTGMVEVLRTTVDTAMELTGARYGALGVLGNHGELVDFIHAGIDAVTADRIGRLPEGRGVLGTIGRDARTIRVDQIDDHPDSVGYPDHHPPMTNFLGVPVRVGDSIFGNLYLAEKAGGFTDEDEALVESLATIAGSAVSTARLHERLRRVALLEDRERIARELHDSVIQELFAVGLSLQAATAHTEHRPDMVRSRILEAVGQLDQSITTLRQYIFDIRRRIWTSRDLMAELEELGAQLARPHGVDVRVSITGDAASLEDDLVDAAVQFAREGVSNAVRHSGAPAVDVIVTIGHHEMVVEVRDGGSGFDLAAVDKGMGLDNLRARAMKAGGVAEIVSRLGRGTVVRAILPIGDDRK